MLSAIVLEIVRWILKAQKFQAILSSRSLPKISYQASVLHLHHQYNNAKPRALI